MFEPNHPVVYLRSVGDPYLKQMLCDFGASMTACELNDGPCWQAGSDLDVFFGSWKDRNLEHHNLKRDIVAKSKRFIVLETALLGRQKVELVPRDRYVRMGLNGFLANTGNFNYYDRPSDRWEKISSDLGLSLEPTNRSKDSPILVALQLPGDASLQGTDISFWAASVIDHIRLLTNKPIILRTPQLPRDYDEAAMQRIFSHPEIYVQEGTKDNLRDTLRNCWAAVTFSSGIGIDALMYGCPVIAYSPASFCFRLCPNSVEYVEHIELPNEEDRQQLFNNLAYAQWSTEELRDGSAWAHMQEAMWLDQR